MVCIPTVGGNHLDTKEAVVMSRKIYLIQNDETLTEMTENPYPSEDILQTLLSKYPDLLAGGQINADQPRRWMLVSREIGIPGEHDGFNRWSLDHLFLDQEGIPTLVEVKRSSDTRIRREVVGQLLDYAANAVVYWPLEKIRAEFEAACALKGEDADSLIHQLIDPLGEGEPDIDSFWKQVKTNLQAGKVRLVFVADVIPPELQRIVEFLNEQMDPAEVLAVEVRQYVGQGLRTLVPQVVGQTAEAKQRKSGSQRDKSKWDEATFFEEFEKLGSPAETAVARALYNWGKETTSYIDWGVGSSSGSFLPVVLQGNVKHQLFVVYTNGALYVYFQYYLNKEPFVSEEKRLTLLRKLNDIPGINLGEDTITKRPRISLSDLVDGDNLQRFIEVFNWVVSEIRQLSL